MMMSTDPSQPSICLRLARGPSCCIHAIAFAFLVVFSARGANAASTEPLIVSTLQASNAVYDMTVDSQGRFLTVDIGTFKVYRILPNGARTTLASGFSNPYGITIDSTANIAYVSDCSNDCLKSVSTSGATTTIAGTCGSIDARADGVGSAARFYHPTGIVYHTSGVLYVCDYYNAAIRRINISTAMVTTVVLDTPLAHPNFLCINRAGTTLYVSDAANHIIVRVDLVPTTATMTTIAGSSGTSGYVDGVGSNARFSGPRGTTMNNDETMLYIADYGNYRIRSMRLSDSYVGTVAGTGASGFKDGPAMTAQFGYMSGLKWYCNGTSGECGLLVADYDNNRVRLVSYRTTTTTYSNVNSLTDSLTATKETTRTTSATHSQSDSVPTLTAQTTNSMSSTDGASLTRSHSVTSLSLSPEPQTPSKTIEQSASRTKSITAVSTAVATKLSLSLSITAALSSVTSSSSISLMSRTLTTSPSVTATQTTSDTLLAPHTHTNTAVVPPPTIVTAVERLRDGIAASTPVLQYSVGVVSTSAMSISRMGAVSRVGSCQSPFTPPQGLLSSRIGGCGAPLTASRSVAAEYARGDVVVAMSALLCVTALLAACCYLYSFALHMQLRDGAAALSTPSVLLPLWGAALPTGVGGMVALGRNWEGCVSDGVLLVFGAVVVVALPMALLVVGTTLMLRRLQIVRMVVATTDVTRCAPLQPLLRVAGEAQWCWQPIPQTATRVHLYGRVLVLQQRVLWYATLDAAVLVAVSVFAAAAVDLPLGTCQALGGAIVALLALQLLVCGVVRPFTTLLDHVVAMTTLGLNVVGAALQLSLLSSSELLVVAVASDLLLLGVSGLKVALDVVELVGAVRRRWSVFIGEKLCLESGVVLEGSTELASLFFITDDEAVNDLLGGAVDVPEETEELDEYWPTTVADAALVAPDVVNGARRV